ncbi:hypothetical protein Ancab_035946 [Ancistrocladus abbreviatus]
MTEAFTGAITSALAARAADTVPSRVLGWVLSPGLCFKWRFWKLPGLTGASTIWFLEIIFHDFTEELLRDRFIGEHVSPMKLTGCYWQDDNVLEVRGIEFPITISAGGLDPDVFACWFGGGL